MDTISDSKTLNSPQNQGFSLEQELLKFKIMANSIPQLAWMTDETGYIYWYNDRWFEYTGTTFEEMQGWGWKSVHHPDHMDAVVTKVKHAFDNGLDWEDTFPLKGANGEYRWFLSRAKTLKDDNGRIIGWFGTNTDITEQREAEQKNRFLLELQDRKRNLDNPDAIIAAAIELLGSHLAVDRSIYATIESDQDHMIIQHNYISGSDIHPITERMKFSDFGVEAHHNMLRGEPYVVDDIDESSIISEIKNNYKSIQVQSFISVPLHKGGKFVGAVAVHSNKPRKWKNREIDLVMTVAQRCWESNQRAIVQKNLAESEERFRKMSDSIDQMIWVTLPDGYHEYYNKRWYEYTGVPEGSTDGEGWNDMFHLDDQPRAWALWQHSLATGEPYEIEYRLRNKDGLYKWVLGRARPMRDDNGVIVKWFGTCTDIEDLKAAELKAEEASIAKTEFLANMSHEIRTPLNAIIGISDILSRESVRQDKKPQLLKTLKSSSDTLLKLVNDILDMNRIEERNFNLDEDRFKIIELLNETVNIIEIKAQEKGLSIHTKFNFEDLYITTDKARLRQVLINILGNAVKFTNEGSVTLSARVDYLVEPPSLQIEVQDTGIGIPEELLGNIFEKFQRGANVGNIPGTGLGLSITKHLLEMIGGTVSIESNLKQGTKVRLIMPVVETLSNPIDEQNTANEVAQSDSAVKYCILLVEDYDPNIIVLSTMLEDLDMDYDIAINGKEALDKLQKNNYHLVLMDINMPVMDGLEATTHYRKWELENKRDPIPVIGITAHALSGDKDKCLAAGMNDYLTKPVTQQSLDEKIKAYLN